MVNTSNQVIRRSSPLSWLVTIVVGGVLIGLIFSLRGFQYSIRPPSVDMMQAHNLVLTCFQYATDPVNEGRYPDGTSSTEALQKLYSEKYLVDPATVMLRFYPDKRPYQGSSDRVVLKPENVAWDMTSPVVGDTPDLIPLVFSTGYRVSYVPGQPTREIPGFFDRPSLEQESWSEWWTLPESKNQIQTDYREGMVVGYKDMSSRWVHQRRRGVIDNFLPPNFDPKDKNYRQLIPTGEL